MDQKELPHYIGYLRKALKTVSNMLIGEELRGFSLKVGSIKNTFSFTLALFTLWYNELNNSFVPLCFMRQNVFRFTK